MAHFVMVVSQVPIAAFDQMMKIVAASNNKVRFIPNSTNAHSVSSPGMAGPDGNNQYATIRFEFAHDAVDRAAEILKIFEGAPAPKS